SVPGRSVMAYTRVGKLSPNTGIERACSKSRRKAVVLTLARLLAWARWANMFWLAPVIEMKSDLSMLTPLRQPVREMPLKRMSQITKQGSCQLHNLYINTTISTSYKNRHKKAATPWQVLI